MTPVYVYEPIKTIHFDFNVQQLEDYLSPRNEIITVVRELIPRHQIFDVYGDIRECRVEMRYTYRILNSNETICFGSYISEQIFYIKYVNEDYTSSQIIHLLNNSLFMTSQEFDNLIIKHNLPKDCSLPDFVFEEYVITDLIQILQSEAT